MINEKLLFEMMNELTKMTEKIHTEVWLSRMELADIHAAIKAAETRLGVVEKKINEQRV